MSQHELIHANIKGIDLVFRTAEGVFSPHAIDKGTLAMLSVVDFKEGDKVLDLGCGYGVAGILAAKISGPENVVMTDIDDDAVLLAKENAVLNGVDGVVVEHSDGFKGLQAKDFTVILSNPPYHADFSVPKEFIEKGFNRLRISGRLFMVTKRREWYKNKLASIFGGVRIWEIDGYYVFMAIKRDTAYANVKKKSR